jgi:hydrogenase nickel incorporation protein HypA/HybF
MHEMSLAMSLAERVAAHLPEGARLLSIQLQAGPMRGIDPEAMDWAWRSAIEQTPLAGATLRLTNLPWSLRCPRCGQEWQSPEADVPCTCGHAAPDIRGGDELKLVSIEVE